MLECRSKRAAVDVQPKPQAIILTPLLSTSTCLFPPCLPHYIHLQVFASGTGNRRHPLFILDRPRRWVRKLLGLPDDEYDYVDSSDLAAVTAANPLPATKKLSPRLSPRSFLSPRKGSKHNEMELPVRSTATAASGASSSSNSLGATLNKDTAVQQQQPGEGEGDFSEPDDVAAERQRVELLPDYDDHPIVVRQLNKTYPGLDGQPPKVREGCVFCLGRKGKGKGGLRLCVGWQQHVYANVI